MQPQTEVNVKVAVRVRPILPKEKLAGEQICVKIVAGSKQLVVGKDRAFTFDNVLSSKTTQDTVYDSCVKPLVKSVFDGYNATVFAYGQTGSGKTYTIGGCNKASLTEDEFGIIPRAIGDMFDIIKHKQTSHDVEYCIRVTYVEIYKEELRDLLDLDTSIKDLHIREDDQGNTIITGNREIVCQSMDEVLYCLEHGSSGRHTGSTQMNEQSSRSHSVFSITIEQSWTTREEVSDQPTDTNSDTNSEEFLDLEEREITNTISGKFHFVDLAGSERANRTGNIGDRFKESIHINTGLLALGNVISALGDVRKKATHIPYRDSKITRLLKDSLGGNAKTLMICCISPSSASFDETLNSLKYANRAKNIKNKPVVNRDSRSARFEEMQTEIKALREELQRQRTSVVTANTEYSLERATEDANQLKKLEDDVIRLQTESSHYKMVAEEAYRQLTDIHQRELLSTSQNARLQDWMDLMEEIKNKVPATLSKDQWQNETVLQLRKEVQKYQEDLKTDEEIFAERNREMSVLQERIAELEAESVQQKQFLDSAEDKHSRLQQENVDKEMKLEELEQKYKKARHVSIGDCEEHELTIEAQQTFSSNDSLPKSSRRAHSAPVAQMRTKYPSTLSTELFRPPSRNIHTSPALFSLERVMQNFRARSHILLNRLEENDEVMHHGFSEDEDGSPSNGSDEEKQQDSVLGRTFKRTDTFNLRGNVPRIRTDDEKISLRDSLSLTRGNKFGATITKGQDKTVSFKDEREAFSVRSSSDLNKKKIKQSQLKVQESSQKMRDLSINIRLKEQLIRDLVQTGKAAQEMNVQYEERIKQLEKEKLNARKELKDIQRAFHDIEVKEHQETKEIQKIRGDYRKKIEQTKSKLSVLQKKQAETEKMANVTGQHDNKIQELQVAITKMKHEHDLLNKRFKDENETKAKLEREVQKELQRIKELEIKNEQQQKILRRKNEEIAAVQRKLRSGSTTNEGTDKLKEQKTWLDGEIEKMIEQQELVRRLEEDLKKREDIIARKEEMLAEKSKIEMKMLRSSQVLNKDILTVSSRLEGVEQMLQVKTKEMTQLSREDKHDKLKVEITQLQHGRDRLQKQMDVLDEKLHKGSLMSPKEERRLIEIDEGIEALEAAIEFKSDVIRNVEMELTQSQVLYKSEDHIMSRLKSLSSTETQSLLYKYFEKVIALRENERKLSLHCSEFETRIDEQERLLREMGGALQSATMESDRRLTQQQSDYEGKIQLLVQQLSHSEGQGQMGDIEKSTKIHQLEKDLYYYKKISRELKKKCGSLTDRSEVTGSRDGSVTGSVHAARGDGDRDKEHRVFETHQGHQNHQPYHSRTPRPKHSEQVTSIQLGTPTGVSNSSPRSVATPVKIHRKELRPMSAEEVIMRKSHLSHPPTPKDSLDDGNNPWT